MQRDLNYLDQLRRATALYQSRISFGLDPVVGTLPDEFPKNILGFYLMLEKLFDHMKSQKVFPGAFKPNYGFYTVHDNGRKGDFNGSEVLGKIMNLIDTTFPNMPIIFDPKNGDIGKSSANYAKAAFTGWNVDSITISPYMGDDSMLPFAEYCESAASQNRGVYALDLTSNLGANLLEMKKMEDGRTLYMHVADWIRTNAVKYPGLGAVVGAPNLDGLREIAKFYAEGDAGVPILVPGVGDQNGKADEVTRVFEEVGYDLDIVRTSVSSFLTQPWGKEPAPKDWMKVIVGNLHMYNRLTGMAA